MARRIEVTRREGSRPTLRSASSFSLLELIRVPMWLVIVSAALRIAWRHKLTTTVIVAWFALYVRTGSFLGSLAILAAAALVIIGGIVLGVRFGSTRSLGTIITEMSRKRAVKTLWAEACFAAGLYTRATEAPMPRSRKVWAVPGGLQWQAFPGAVGATATAVQKKSEEFASVLGVERVAIRRDAPYAVTITAYWDKLFGRIVEPHEIEPFSPASRVSFALGEAGVVSVRKDTSILIGGVTGGGKSSVIAALIGGLIRDGEHYRLRVLDPAGGVELAYLNPENGARAWTLGSSGTHRYSPRAAEAAKLLKDMRHAMDARLAAMPAGLRQHKPTATEPLDIFIMDELLLVDLKGQAGTDLKEILAVGRKAGFVVWACTQDATVETVGPWRRLFRQRISLATENPTMTNVILGDNAEANGAKCSQLGPDDAGMGWMYQDGMRGYVMFRSAYYTDADVKYLGRCEFPPDLENEPTDLYYAWRADGSLYYIGISNDFARRLREHETDEPDWLENVARCEVVRTYPNRSEALKAEAKLIRKHGRTLRNIAHNDHAGSAA